MNCEFETVEQLGALCRKRREALGLRIEDAAMVTGANYRWISEIERGKATAQFGKVLHYAASLGIGFAAILPDDSPLDRDLGITP
jgi:HTH-type transcriptional regulator/antitoxin HipB